MIHARRRLRVSLQAKVMAAVLTLLVALPAVTLWIVDRQISRQTHDDASLALTTARAFFLQSLDNRSSSLVARYRNVVLDSRFQRVVRLDDANTMKAYLRDLLDEFADDTELVAFVKSDGKLQAGARRDPSLALEDFVRVAGATVTEGIAGEPSSKSLCLAGRAYNVVAIPAVVPGSELSGALLVGVRLGQSALQQLAPPRTQILLLGDDAVVASTLKDPDAKTAALWSPPAGAAKSASDEVREVVINGERFLALTGDYHRTGAQNGFRYVLLSSYEQRLRTLEQTRLTLLGLSVVGILVSAAIVWIFVARVTRPLRELRDSAEAVGRGDFSRRLTHFSNDECGELAETFNQMTANLQGARVELEKTVDTLKATQTQLIQSEKLSAVGQFVAGVAHELNNPLTAVIGFSDFLAETADAKIRPQLAIIAKSAHRCHKIVQSLLGFARQHAPERKLVKINDTIDEVIEIMAYDFRTSNIKVVRAYQPDLPVITADPHQLQQVFINILGNARQAIQPYRNEGTITLRTLVAGASIRIELEDDGPGIKPEHLSRIFDPFFTTKPVGKGTGLGMSLSYGIIHEHGGKISVRSELGRGTTFVIDLPATITGQVTRGGSIAPHGAKRAVPTGKVVLIIDDEEWILTLAVALLRAEGYEVLTAQGGEKALELLTSRKFDVIVCDWKMPGLNGIQLYEHLCAINPLAASRMIFTTGDIISDTFQEFLRRCSKNCLAKPFAIEDFRAAVAGMVEAARA